MAIVASGTAFAQAIAMAFAPIVTRLYGPEAFGVLGTFSAVVAVMAPIAALNYPIAIVLPKKSADALGLAQLSIMIAATTSTFIALILAVFKNPIVELLNLHRISTVMFLVPLVMFFSACVAVASQWAIREKLFGIRARVLVAQSLVLNGAKVGVGLFSPLAAVLVILAALGTIFHALVMMICVWKNHKKKNRSLGSPAPLRQLAKRHRDFPLYRAPQDFMNTASQGLPVILLAAFFGPAAAGFYSLGRTVMGLPVTLVAQSLGEVFYPHITNAAHDGKQLSHLILKATLGLAIVGILPFTAVIVFGPQLFSLVFGPDWSAAGEYTRWISVMLFFNFINRPSVAAVPVLNLQRGLLVYEVFSTGTKALALYVGFSLFSSDIVAVAIFAMFGALAYITLIAWVLLTARTMDAEKKYAQQTS